MVLYSKDILAPIVQVIYMPIESYPHLNRDFLLNTNSIVVRKYMKGWLMMHCTCQALQPRVE
jgi:hypothetical protein